MDAPTIGLLLLSVVFGLTGFWLGYKYLHKRVKDLTLYKIKFEKLEQDFDALKKADEELQLKYLNATYSIQEEERRRIGDPRNRFT